MKFLETSFPEKFIIPCVSSTKGRQERFRFVPDLSATSATHLHFLRFTTILAITEIEIFIAVEKLAIPKLKTQSRPEMMLIFTVRRRLHVTFNLPVGKEERPAMHEPLDVMK
mgnify:CR=1 FL=1